MLLRTVLDTFMVGLYGTIITMMAIAVTFELTNISPNYLFVISDVSLLIINTMLLMDYLDIIKEGSIDY